MTDRTLTATDSDSDSWTRIQTNYRTARAAKFAALIEQGQRVVFAMREINEADLPVPAATSTALAPLAAAIQVALIGSRWELEPEQDPDDVMGQEVYIRLPLPSPSLVPYLQICVSADTSNYDASQSSPRRAIYTDTTATPPVTLPEGAQARASIPYDLRTSSSITVAWSRSARAHAAELARRLLPAMVQTYMNLAELVLQEQGAHDLTKATVARFAALGAIPIPSYDDRRTMTMRIPECEATGLKYDLYLKITGDSVYIERISLTPEGVECLIKALIDK